MSSLRFYTLCLPPISLHRASFFRSLFSTYIPLSFSTCPACRKSDMLIMKPTKHDKESAATLKIQSADVQRKEMVTETASSLLLPRSVLVVRTAAMRMPLTKTSLDFAANVSLSHIHTKRCAHTDTYTRACLQAPHSPASGSFCLPSNCRLVDRGSEGGLSERSVARQNGWSHEQRSVYKPKAEQSESKGRKGKASCRLSLSTIKD